MTDKLWKAAERRIASFFGAKRRGADFRGENAGKSDVVKPGWSIEVKSLTRPAFGDIVQAVWQAKTNRFLPGDIPVAVIHKVGEPYVEAIVAMFLDDFIDNFVELSSSEGGEESDTS